MYSEKVMDHFSNPRNVGEIENPSGTGTVGNAKCGDIMKMDIQVEDGMQARNPGGKNRTPSRRSGFFSSG